MSFYRMNPQISQGGRSLRFRKNVEELQEVFDIMHIVYTEHVELSSYQLKGVVMIWYQLEEQRVDRAPHLS